ncbi:hypothetical protein A7M79_01680 [Acinetobacter baumannii]|uniref:hypothetical protein n=1 Tax=Acinetobacter baumannii TaxID=470 RepID=UPI0008DDB50F|nr:hypothetical protein [Acinetobacter baumannii]OIH12227.1 hypothetical protein A7M79_01680 [Acinetobacter baumannii]
MNLVCPDCNSNLEFCVEENVLHKRTIDPKTGKLRKPIKKESQGNETQRSLIQCVCCTWSCTDGDGEWYKLQKACNKDQIAELIDHVNDKAVKQYGG